MVALALSTSACAAATGSLQSAISIHNTTERVIKAVDAGFTPIYTAAGNAADVAWPDDNAAYAKAMAPLKTAMDWLNEAKQAEQLLQLGVAQWQSGVVGGEAMAREMAACGMDAVSRLGDVAELIPGVGPIIAREVLTLASDFTAIAAGATCNQQAVPK